MSSPTTTATTTSAFTLTSPPGTDIWRKPPTHDVFSAPTHPSPLPVYPLSTFQRARLTFALPPRSQLRQYDQAGLVLRLSKPGEKDKWLKTGIEWYEGAPWLSTVGADRWADWSVAPLENAAGGEGEGEAGTDGAETEGGEKEKGPSATVEARREKDVLGKSLWVYDLSVDAQGEAGTRRPLREVNWVFAEEEGWSVGVGAYVARPTVEGGEGELVVSFERGVEVEVLDG